MRHLILPLILLLSASLSAQYGVRLQYGNLSSDSAMETDNSLYNTEQVVNNGTYLEVGIDYWLQPWEERRIEFTPALMYGLGSYGIDRSGFDYSAASMVLNTRIYPMDFEGDCNCPTFSKDGSFVSKGFFFEVSPGVIYNNWRLQTDSFDPLDPADERINNVSWRASIGAGIDIGVSDLLTLSPTVTYQLRGGHAPFDALEAVAGDLLADPAAIGTGLLWGLRIGIRTDTNNYGYR